MCFGNCGPKSFCATEELVRCRSHCQSGRCWEFSSTSCRRRVSTAESEPRMLSVPSSWHLRRSHICTRRLNRVVCRARMESAYHPSRLADFWDLKLFYRLHRCLSLYINFRPQPWDLPFFDHLSETKILHFCPQLSLSSLSSAFFAPDFVSP